MDIDEDLNQLRPSLMQVENELRRYKRVSWFVSIGMSLLFIIIWPVVSLAFDDFSLAAFNFWIISGHVLIFISAAFFLFGPLIERHFIKIVEVAKKSSRFFKRANHLTAIRHVQYDSDKVIESNI